MADTICAVATPPGRGGVGIIRLSGPDAYPIGRALLKRDLRPRFADYGAIHDDSGDWLDNGIALYFPSPHSFTGEDVVELQAHGGPVLLDLLIKAMTRLGARLAKPGEFSERAFLNDKLDLAQAEAIADLIAASSEQAARQAVNSMNGAFSEAVNALAESCIHLRVYVEAAIDFPDEEVDFLSEGRVAEHLADLLARVDDVFRTAQQGALLRDGMTVVIAGQPNAGKSSLLNALSGQASAIVTEIAGTTRDILHETIQIDGLPLHIIDTAGLRATEDKVEQAGIDRAWAEISRADRVLLVVDSERHSIEGALEDHREILDRLPAGLSVTQIRNKCDLTGEPAGLTTGREAEPFTAIVTLSAETGTGMESLRNHLKTIVGYESTTEGGYIARRRHLEALTEAHDYIRHARDEMAATAAGELVAENLRMAQQALNTITGEFTSDDLLGEIFSSFCIGK